MRVLRGAHCEHVVSEGPAEDKRVVRLLRLQLRRLADHEFRGLQAVRLRRSHGSRAAHIDVGEHGRGAGGEAAGGHGGAALRCARGERGCATEHGAKNEGRAAPLP